MVKILLQGGANPHIKDGDGKNPRDIAVKKGVALQCYFVLISNLNGISNRFCAGFRNIVALLDAGPTALMKLQQGNHFTIE